MPQHQPIDHQRPECESLVDVREVSLIAVDRDYRDCDLPSLRELLLRQVPAEVRIGLEEADTR